MHSFYFKRHPGHCVLNKHSVCTEMRRSQIHLTATRHSFFTNLFFKTSKTVHIKTCVSTTKKYLCSSKTPRWRIGGVEIFICILGFGNRRSWVVCYTLLSLSPQDRKMSLSKKLIPTPPPGNESLPSSTSPVILLTASWFLNLVIVYFKPDCRDWNKHVLDTSRHFRKSGVLTDLT